ncbi:MAG: hypothetical protein ACFFAV_08925 [Candidatus Hermodarchaeota archaeon]
MEKIELIFEKINKVIPGAVFGLLSITAGIIGDIISYLIFPCYSYNFLTMAVSNLCLGSGGIFFNIGNIFSGVFALVFVNSLIMGFNEEDVDKKIKKIALICANISCIAFVILGVFCGSDIIVKYIHGISAITSWIFGYSYITFCNLLMLKDKKYSSKLSIFGLIITFPLLLLMILFFLHLIPVLKDSLIIILAPLEWVSTISVIIWYFSVSTYMIYKGI